MSKLKAFADDSFSVAQMALFLFDREENYCGKRRQEGHDGPVSLHWLICEIPSYQALQYLVIGLKYRPLTRTKIGSHSSYVKHQEDFERLRYMKPRKTCNPWKSI